MCFHKGTPKIKNLFVKICFALVTLCIVGLTVIAGYILISNHKSQIIGHDLVQDVAISYDKNSKEIDSKNSINNNSDSIGMTVINNDEHRVVNTELNLPEPSGLIDSIISELTLAVNSVNNVLTSGSILVAILTLFIALVGIFAYHDLKIDVRDELNKTNNLFNKNIQEAKDSIITYKNVINSRLKEAQDKQKSDIENSNQIIEDFKNGINNMVKEAQDKQTSSFENFTTVLNNFKIEIKNRIEHIEIFNASMVAQFRFFNKSIDYLYDVLSTLTEKLDDPLLRDMLFHDFYINTLYRYDIDPDSKESKAILHHKKAAIEFLKDKGTIEDIKDLEIVAENEPNEEIKQKIYELIGIIKHNKS